MEKINVLIINDDPSFTNKLKDIIVDYPIISLTNIGSADSFIDISVTTYDLILLDFIISKEVDGRIRSSTCRSMYDFIKKFNIDCVIMSDNSKENLPPHYIETDVWKEKDFEKIPYMIMERIIKRF